MSQLQQVNSYPNHRRICEACHAKESCLVSALSSNELEKFEQAIIHRTPINRGDRVFMAGDPIKSLFLIHSGSIKSYVESPDGDNQITGFHLPGDLIGFQGVEEHTHSDTVEALETSSVCELPMHDMHDICESFPALHKRLMGSVFGEMSHEQDLLLVLGKMSADRRLAHFLLDISTRLAKHGLSDQRICLTMTRHDIANYLGLAVETVSRILTRFQNANIIDVERRTINILQHDTLLKIFNCAEQTIKSHQARKA